MSTPVARPRSESHTLQLGYLFYPCEQAHWSETRLKESGLFGWKCYVCRYLTVGRIKYQNCKVRLAWSKLSFFPLFSTGDHASNTLCHRVTILMHHTVSIEKQLCHHRTTNPFPSQMLHNRAEGFFGIRGSWD